MNSETNKGSILVTGGAGYIGSHTAVELVEAGYDVVIADNLSNSTLGAIEGVRRITGRDIPFAEVDCNDAEALGEVFRRWRFDAVIHFAAFKSVGESTREPLKYYRNNLGSLLTVLESMCVHGVPNIVFSSSATVYGQPEVLPATESTPRRPATSPYGATKQICEDILRDTATAARDGNLRGISLRYFNPIGAHRSALIGELPRGVPGNLVPFITQTAARNVGDSSGRAKEVSHLPDELLIFGDDYPTPDGTAQRDYIDIVDLARAHVVAVERMIGDRQLSSYEVFNIGTGRPVSVMELVRTFERVNGMKLNCKIAPRRPGDIAAIWADTALAERELGWRATHPLEETLSSAWAWERRLRGL